MDLSWALQLATTLCIGAVCFFIKGFIGEMKKANEEHCKNMGEMKTGLENKIESERDRSESNYKDLGRQINELKDSMPFVFVLKEDWIRVSNATDQKINSIDNKVDKILDAVGTKQEERRT